MATSARPSHVPLPARDPATRPAPPADVPPTPSAFPALPAHSQGPQADTAHDDHPHPHPQPTQPGISYAKVSKHLLPPSNAPQGTSLPPPPPQPPKLSSHNSKERLQPSQNGRDSPYARGTPSSATSSSSANKPRAKANRGSNAHGQGPNKPAVNGKPVANWVPEKVGVHAPAVHSRAASSSGIPAPVSTSTSPATSTAGPTDPPMHTVGKKRRQTLRKVLPPTSSKLSPFAASFDFVPGGGPSLGAPVTPQPQPDAHEQRDSSSPPASSSSSSAPASGDEGAASAGERELLTAAEQRAIQQTVGSAGAQGDDFRKKGFSATDAEGAVESAGAEPGMQSAGADKSTSLSIAEDEAPRRRAEAASLEVEQPREDRPLGAFLDEAFVHASGAFAPLSLPEHEGRDADPERTQPQVRPADELRIPGAVDASPVANLEWRDKQGWWSEGYDPLAAAPAVGAGAAEDVEPEREQAHEPALAEPAIESAQAHDYEPILRFPAWSPAAAAGSSSADEGRIARDLVKDGGSPTPLSTFLDSAFVDSAAERLVAQDGADGVDDSKPDGSSLLSEQELRDIASTVGSAGAQGDGFVKPGFTEADRQGAEEAAGNEAADQSAQGYKPSAQKEEEVVVVDVASQAEAEQPAPVDAARSPTPSPSPSSSPAPAADIEPVEAATSTEAPVAPAVVDSPSSPAPTTPSALSSFLSSSFAAPLETGWTAFEPLDERRAEALAAAGPLSPSQVDPNDFPTSAEAVAAMPRLDDVLDVDIDAEGKVVPEVEGAEPQQETSSTPVVAEDTKEEKRGWWNADEPASAPVHEQHADGSSLLSAAEQRDVASTVGSAGAQGDEFTKKSFAAADAEGAQVAGGADPAQQSAGVGATSVPGAEEGAAGTGPSEDEVKAAEDAQARSSGTQTPLGSFLGQAFSGEPSSATEAPVASTSTAAEPAFSSFASTSTPAVSSPPAAAPAAQRSSSRSPSRSRSPSPSRPARRTADNDGDDDDEGAPPHKSADSAPSLTLAIASAWHTAPWTRKMWAVLASVAINVGCRFGELFARNFIGVRLGWPLGGSSSSSSSGARANTSGVGLRAAGGRRADVPGHAGAKTAVEAAGEAVREAAE
ncbi:uncharacterized protein RHOBADRAFT_52258 [Rhodotorula graminis WP1]|uniref:Proteophosphoglycan ppg4 n=1 Tax=Rhodotorula graminis (strain WP1) TaxID=578459 RepID=A0A194S6U9_RHOGW|nr:uncharacterized protein RHOBADRAFT_52258 [Rhodotorula graminis WP1]KPV76220.1 hypothetical protein RHOBADRAFT_52258 [Rhodotorula graminis WP1]